VQGIVGDMASAIFHSDGDHFIPTDLARGPWSREAQHGGAPSALLARSVEGFEDGERMFVARLTIDLLRPVPIAPLTVRERLLRPGKKVQLVEASLFAGTVEVARCTALRIRRAEIRLPPGLPTAPAPAGPGEATMLRARWSAESGDEAYHSHAVEHRFVAGGFDQPGPATDWIRLLVPLVDGERTSPLCRVAAAADFGNGVSSVLNPAEGYLFINPDLTIYLDRHPDGEWVCLDAVTRVQPHGVGLAESLVADQRGPIGRAVQSLLLEKLTP
jgi:hypothetical protein